MTGADRPGEFELIARVFAPLAGEGAFGLVDDAAVLTPPPGEDLVLTKDAVVAGVHFFPDDPWDAVAQKALRVNLSDLAAKGARPLGYLLGLGLPDGWRTEDAEALGRGLALDQDAYGLRLLGGDTVRSPERLMLSVTVFGAVPAGRMARRGGATPRDVIVVTGTIGDAALGLKLRLDAGLSGRLGLADADRDHLLDRYLLPRPRSAVAGAVLAHAGGAMDVSDGLVGDLAKMAAASGVAIRLDASRVPLSDAARAAIAADPALLRTALGGGDDYEIAVALDEDDCDAFVDACRDAGVAATPIGRAEAGRGVTVVGTDGAVMDLGAGSYAHF
ncbi:thiamine-phosphate kinase [Oharaeibacter diazotrophicus]|uniref:Thiamine-monophosphate kinase n=2 Tax=Oharaeibacter diazotrophicus TaxID=1920512 RepID=A0A4R6RJB7_9HYPH|nr:thiamine-phosphate kinase [Oharaeibacter diazotrophicus]TDP86504.1 thiamine-phosphate kinase [Oharaeibacter diazotrophicus]BBE71554.1 thiamine-monophosphate kinase [Pleomorphomonas sp. SM30]GLS78314.1 thiamine-monophosphate kinase [Oharaeibacter diazotrophicus]